MKGIKKVIADLETQSKMIKIADKSPGGWETVKEYLSESIASDSKDKRRLRAVESRALRKKQNFRKSYCYNSIHSTTPSSAFNHQIRNVGEIQFCTQHSFSLPIINSKTRTSSHTLTAATSKAPLSPLVDQIPQQPALREGELDTDKETAPLEEISEDKAELFEDKCTFLSSFHFMPDDFDIDSHNSDFDTLRNKANIKESLRKNLEHWHYIRANPSVIDAIDNSHKVPFLTTPVSKLLQNNQSALQNANFVTCTVNKLLKSGRIKEPRAPPYIVSPITLAKNSHNKPRLILHLRYFNSFVYKDKIKFNDLRTMQDFVDNKGFLYKFDISQGYHHIEIDENHQKYLDFSSKIDGKIRYFMFTVLLLRLRSAQFIFTKVMLSLVKFWKREGIKICVYIDDGLGVFPLSELALEKAESIRKSLTQCGFIINSEKSIWQPQK